MQWLKQFEEIEKLTMQSVPTSGGVKHALKENSDEIWTKLNDACAKEEEKTNALITSLKKDTDTSTHPFIDSILHHILVARNKKVQECLDILKESESAEAKKLSTSLNGKIANTAAIVSTKMPESLIKKVLSTNEAGFDRSVYDALLPYAECMFATEEVGIPEEHAYKLAKIFSSRFDAIKYLLQYQINHPKNPQVMHDACLFIFSGDNCTVNIWQQLALKHISNEEYWNLLPNAGEIEKLITDDVKKNKPKANEIKALNKDISTLTTEWKALGKKKSQLTPKQEERYDELTKEISEKRVTLSEAYAGTPFSNTTTVEMLRAYYERYKTQCSKTHAEFIANHMTSKDYEKFVKLKRVDDDKRFPPFTLDGKEFGYPGLYVMKAPVLEEKWASKMARMGKETGCCQSLSGQAGEPCAIHLLTSPEGAGFLVAQGDFNNPKPEDTLYAGCWAWRSKKDRVVEDSVENNRSILDQGPSIHLMRRYGYEYVKRGYTDKVVCGAASGISRLVGVEDFFDNTPEEFIDYNGYNDSRIQLTIYDKKRPYYFYGQEEFANTETHALLDEILKDKQPLESSKEFTEMVNWAIVTKCNALLDKIKQSAKDRENEVNEHIKRVNECISALNHGDIDKFLEFAKPGPLHNIINENRSNALMFAAKAGHVQAVTKLLKGGNFVIDHRDKSGASALFKAIESGSAETVQVLIDAGADVKQPDECGDSALIKAIESGSAEIVKLLIKVGADIKQPNKYGESALFKAIESGSAEIVKLLIIAGADIKQPNQYGESALFKAIGSGSAEIVKLLINAGADIKQPNQLGASALFVAMKSDSAETVQVLIDAGVDINQKNKNNSTPVSFAAYNGHTKIMLALIKAGAEHNLNSLLTSAVNSSYVETAKTLIAMGASTLDTSLLENAAWCSSAETVAFLKRAGAPYDNDKMLTSAVLAGREETVKLLLEDGANPDVRDEHGGVPLCDAAHREKPQILEELIQAKADLNIRSIRGGAGLANTALIEAAASHSLDNVQKLLKAGADVNMPNKGGWTPLHWLLFMHSSYRTNTTEIAQALIDAGANLNTQDRDGNTPLHAVVVHPNIDCIKLLIEKGADLRLANNKGKTPLQLAEEIASSTQYSKEQYIEITSLLATAQAAHIKSHATQLGFFQTSQLTMGKIDQYMKSDDFDGLLKLLHETRFPIDTWIVDEDDNHCTLLMHACELCALKTVEALLKAGADPKKTDPDGDTAAAYAVDSDKNSTAILDLLREKGVDFRLPNFEKETVLDRAKEYEDEDMVKYLSEMTKGPTLTG